MEEMAIMVCDADSDGCLTWDETKDCEEKYSKFFEQEGIPVPTEEDFKALNVSLIIFNESTIKLE